MQVIDARNVNIAWRRAKTLLSEGGLIRPSRYGQVVEFPEPVTTAYRRPCERVLFDPVRDCNPYFHLFESFWMLAGRADVKWVSEFSSRIGSFSDDGAFFHGAYGERWRSHFLPGVGSSTTVSGSDDRDQLTRIVSMLRANEDERRCVLQMWDPTVDLWRDGGKDLPCNTNVYFKIRQGRLLMTVCNRSNDIVWGCYGANVVHMSMLHEYVAAMVGKPVGTYWQMSDSWHAYTEIWNKMRDTSYSHVNNDAYSAGLVEPRRLVDDPDTFNADLRQWVNEDSSGYQRLCRDHMYNNSFFSRVADPLLLSWRAYKQKDLDRALALASQCEATDWRLACQQWLERRVK